MKKIRLVVCDDFNEICEHIEFFCNREEDIDCVATANSSSECIEMVKKYKPDILLLDIQMENDNSGISILPELMKIHPEMKIIILTAHFEDEYIFSSFALGVSDYLLKSLPFKEMVSVIRKVANDQSTIRPEVAKILASNSLQMRLSLLYLVNILVKLSVSELAVLKDVYNGLSYSEIAKKRYVTTSTVKNHALRIMKKFQVHSMKKLVEELRELKIFDLISDENIRDEL